MKRLRTFLYLALVLGLAVGTAGCGGCGGANNTKVRLQGAGSSFVEPMMGLWKAEYGKAKGVEIEYQGTGSGDGQNSLLKMEVDFACSDAPLSDTQIKEFEAKGTVLHLPICMGGVVPAYNLGKDVDIDLRFSGEILVGIFQGDIKTWDDPKILAIQTDEVKSKIPKGLEITAVVREDASGTTFIFTDYLNKVLVKVGDKEEKAWKGGKAAKDYEFHTPKLLKGKKNAGVANTVQRTVGSVGYMELNYAKEAKIAYGSVRNSKGKDLKADNLAAITAAADSTEIPDDLRYSIVAAPGENAYPIAGTVWALVYTRQPADKGKALAEFLTWVTGDEGQKLCARLDYARLPDKIVTKVEGKIKQIEVH